MSGQDGKVELYSAEARQAMAELQELKDEANASYREALAYGEDSRCYPDEPSTSMLSTVSNSDESLRPFEPKAAQHSEGAAQGHQDASDGVTGIDESNGQSIKSSGDGLGTAGLGNTVK